MVKNGVPCIGIAEFCPGKRNYIIYKPSKDTKVQSWKRGLTENKQGKSGFVLHTEKSLNTRQYSFKLKLK